jgi:hypothetical protein
MRRLESSTWIFELDYCSFTFHVQPNNIYWRSMALTLGNWRVLPEMGDNGKESSQARGTSFVTRKPRPNIGYWTQGNLVDTKSQSEAEINQRNYSPFRSGEKYEHKKEITGNCYCGGRIFVNIVWYNKRICSTYRTALRNSGKKYKYSPATSYTKYTPL